MEDMTAALLSFLVLNFLLTLILCALVGHLFYKVGYLSYWDAWLAELWNNRKRLRPLIHPDYKYPVPPPAEMQGGTGSDCGGGAKSHAE